MQRRAKQVSLMRDSEKFAVGDEVRVMRVYAGCTLGCCKALDATVGAIGTVTSVHVPYPTFFTVTFECGSAANFYAFDLQKEEEF